MQCYCIRTKLYQGCSFYARFGSHRSHPFFSFYSSWDPAGGFDEGLDEDELDMDDPAMEELGFALQPKTKRAKRKERKVGLDNGHDSVLTLPSHLT